MSQAQYIYVDGYMCIVPASLMQYFLVLLTKQIIILSAVNHDIHNYPM